MPQKPSVPTGMGVDLVMTQQTNVLPHSLPPPATAAWLHWPLKMP